MYANHIARAEQCRAKIGHCLRMAQQNADMFRETSDNSWRFMRDEALQDARYWQRELEKVTTTRG